MNITSSTTDKSVSAVLFCYNEVEYIQKTIRSIQNQSIAVENIIIVDDFSTDGTVKVIKQLASTDGRIQCIQNKYKKGKVGAYQTGLERVRTEYFFVIGADDEANPNLVKESLEYIEKNETSFVFNSAEMIDENSCPLNRQFISSFDAATCFYYNKTGGLIFARSKIIEEIIPFPSQLEFEDWYTVLTLFQRFGRVETSVQPLIKYRIHSRSDSQASRWDWHRRRSLLERDIRFLKLMRQREATNESAREELSRSIRFRERLIRGLPSLGKDIRMSMILLKSYLSLSLSRIISRLAQLRIKAENTRH
ncbi:glycosyltransferase family 2 protein [Sedimenticola thiotaurini]|uniref:Glycosyltransferase 2-like domain-containing protein n=1 Tax=Sedimenticola thiotaurini TaxID=1543721 RepID=A0A0F7JZS4_9GAMM|nr:glycosyltransferase family 2 protein [Sedimenticola thiotaurini]AKH20844.1 hypothetical protein AAY24_11345 [Sedimenticola thiotaurini]